MDQGNILLAALGNSGIGKAAISLLEKAMPPVLATPESFCNQNHVANMVQNG
jgi:hypothetical protein